MSRLIHNNNPREGDIFCKWLDSRLIRNNKNVLGANLGPTGSGKSYRDLRMAELWYQYHFNEDFPVANICFGVSTVMRHISSGKLRKGEIIIFEEAGVNMGSLDFQNKISKMFNYILQSFRSMNIAIFFNLPYLSMLNKSARMLLHYQFESTSIDSQRKLNICKPFFNQVNQKTGKIYPKYPRVRRGNKMVKIQRFAFGMPSEYLAKAYETKKSNFLVDLSSDYLEKMEELDQENVRKAARKELTDVEQEVFDLWIKGNNLRMTAEILGKTASSIRSARIRCEKKGFKGKKYIYERKDGEKGQNP